MLQFQRTLLCLKFVQLRRLSQRRNPGIRLIRQTVLARPKRPNLVDKSLRKDSNIVITPFRSPLLWDSEVICFPLLNYMLKSSRLPCHDRYQNLVYSNKSIRKTWSQVRLSLKRVSITTLSIWTSSD